MRASFPKYEKLEVKKCLICSGSIREVFNCSGHPIFHCQTCDFEFIIENIEPQYGISKVEATNTPLEFEEGSLRNREADKKIAKRSLDLRIPIFETAFGGKINSVCEVGCSTGIGFYPFRDRGIKWIGLETNPRWIEYGKEKQIPIIDTELAKVEQTFDLIYLQQVLEHIWDPVDFMNTVFDKLNPGGIVHIAVPNNAGFTASFRRKFPRYFPNEYGMIQFPNHLRAYTPKNLKKLFSIAGLQPIEVLVTRNADDCWGQWWEQQGNFLYRLFFYAGDLIGLGSLLYGYAKKPSSKIP